MFSPREENAREYRQTIDKNEHEEAVAEATELLSLKYILSPKNGGFKYTFNDLYEYLVDYINRGVHTAVEFINKAILEDLNAVERVLLQNRFDIEGQSPNSLQRERYEAVVKLIKESKLLIEQEDVIRREQLAYHYLNLDDDKDAIRYNIKDAEKYVIDWGTGIETAQDYVVQVLKENIVIINQIYNKLKNADIAEKLVDLILQHQEDIIDVKWVYSLKSKKTILSSDQPEKIAEALVDASSLSILNDVLEGRASRINKRIIQMNALSFIKSPELIVAVCEHFNDEELHAAATNMYHACISIGSNTNRETFISALDIILDIKNNADSNAKPVPTPAVGKGVVIKLQQEITLNFYLANLQHNIESMLDIMYYKNPRQFTQLFCADLARVAKENIDEIKVRADFLRTLMTHPDMEHFYAYADCLQAVNNAFNKANLKPITAPEAVVLSIREIDPTELEMGIEFYSGSKKTNQNDISELKTTSVTKKIEQKPASSLISLIGFPSTSKQTGSDPTPKQTGSQSSPDNNNNKGWFSFLKPQKDKEMNSVPVKKGNKEKELESDPYTYQ